MRRFLITENQKGANIQFWTTAICKDKETISYDFESWEEAIEALPNLPEGQD